MINSEYIDHKVNHKLQPSCRDEMKRCTGYKIMAGFWTWSSEHCSECDDTDIELSLPPELLSDDLRLQSQPARSITMNHSRDQKWLFCFRPLLEGYHHVQVSDINIGTGETALHHKQRCWSLVWIKRHAA